MRARKHQPKIITSNNRLQIRINYQGSRLYLSLGLPDTAKNKRLADKICLEMESDISLGCFDATLKKYRDLTPNKSRECKAEPKTQSLSELWEKYTSFKAPQLEETTIEIKYKNVSVWITKLPTDKITDTIAIRDWLLTQTSVANAKYLLQQLSSCCRWALKSGLIESNPFQGLSADIKEKKGRNQIDPFSRDEMVAIVNAFNDKQDHYAAFVEFLFLTGCRTSEAIGLKWKDIDPDMTVIAFKTAIVRLGGRVSIKSLKTQEMREFPINLQLKSLLERIKPVECNPESFVFKPTDRSRTKHISHSTFLENHWMPIVNELLNQGKVQRYRPQYNTRHTFITLALIAKVDVATVAKWVGNSPKTIWQHYAGFNKDESVPEF